MNKSQHPRRHSPEAQSARPKLHPNAAFIKTAEILLTPEGYQQIKELAEQLETPNIGARA